MSQRREESNWPNNQDFHAIILDNEDVSYRKEDILSEISDLSDCDENSTDSKSMILMQYDFANNIEEISKDDASHAPIEARNPIEWPQSPESQKKELCRYLKLIKPSEIKEEPFSFNRRSKRVKKLVLERGKLLEEPVNKKPDSESANKKSFSKINNNLKCKHSTSANETVNLKKYKINVKQLVNVNKINPEKKNESPPRKKDVQLGKPAKKTFKSKVYRRIRRNQNWDINSIITKRKRRKAAINSNYLNVKSSVPKQKIRNNKRTKVATKQSISSTKSKQGNCKLDFSTGELPIMNEKELKIHDTTSNVRSKLKNYRIELNNFFDDARQLPNVSLEHRKQLLRTLDVSLSDNESHCRKSRLCNRSPDFIGFHRTDQPSHPHFSFDVYEKATNLLPKLLKQKSLKNDCKLSAQVPERLDEISEKTNDLLNINNVSADAAAQLNISIIEHDYLGYYPDSVVDNAKVRNSICLHECDHDYCRPSNSVEIDSESDSENDSDGKSSESGSTFFDKLTPDSQIADNHIENTDNNKDELNFNIDSKLLLMAKCKSFNASNVDSINCTNRKSPEIKGDDLHLEKEPPKTNHNILSKESLQLDSLGIESFIPALKTDFSLSLGLNFNGDNKIDHIDLDLSTSKNLNENPMENSLSPIEDNLTRRLPAATETDNVKICHSELINPSEIVKNPTNFLPFQNGAEVRSLHKSLTAPKRKLSDDEWLCSRNKARHKILEPASSHSIFIANENGPILNIVYVDFHLFICQEFTVSLWQQTALGNILGAQNMWLGQGRVQRLVLNGECARKKSREMVLNTDTSVAYVELWTKEHKSDFRQGPVADVFATVYFWKQRQMGLEKKVIQLENIKGFAKDVQYIVCRNSPKIIVSWYYVSENKKSTYVHAYELAEDFQMLSNVYELQPVNHYVSSLHNIEDCDGLIVGCGDCKITLWNVLYGYKVATIDLKLTAPPLTLWVKSDRGFLFIVQEFEDMELQLIAINGINHSWKRLASYHPPAGFNSLRGVSIENGILISFYEQGILCWNVQTAEPIVEEIPTETEYIPSGKYVIMIVNDQVIVRHAITHLIASDESPAS